MKKFNYQVADTARQLWGQYFKDRRQERGWTQEQLADMVGCNRRRIIEIEAGRHNYTVDLFIALIGCLRGEVLIKWKDPDHDVPGIGKVGKN